MEASAVTHASRRGLLARRSPVLKLERDERLIALIRSGHDRAFEVLFDRYHARLLAFCSSMLKSRQDAEDVLQEVFVNAHKAMLGDDRKINVRPWLYRIARNRCLNHLRKPVPEGQDSMDIHPHLNGTSTAERVQKREELRQVLNDVGTLPETQRTALLLREIDQLSYEEIAVAMETTIPAVKSLLVRARITLAESSEARTLSCDEVRVTLAEAAEGIKKAGGPVRLHVRGCESCTTFRKQLRSDRKALAAIFPIGPLALLKTGLLAKLFGGGAGGTGAAGGGGAAASTGAVGALGGGAAAGTTATAGGLGAVGGAIGGKAAAGVATAALITAGAVEVTHEVSKESLAPAAVERVATLPPSGDDKGPRKDKFARRLLSAAAGTGAAVAVVEEAVASEESAVAEEPPPAVPVEQAKPAPSAGRDGAETEELPELPDAVFEDEGTGGEREAAAEEPVPGEIVQPEPEPEPSEEPGPAEPATETTPPPPPPVEQQSRPGTGISRPGL